MKQPGGNVSYGNWPLTKLNPRQPLSNHSLATGRHSGPVELWISLRGEASVRDTPHLKSFMMVHSRAKKKKKQDKRCKDVLNTFHSS